MGVGSAEAAPDADARAYGAIAEQLRATVSRAFSSEQTEDDAASHTRITSAVETSAQQTLSGLRVVERWTEGRTTYSLAALDRAVALADVSQRRAARASSVDAGRRGAMERLQRGDLAGALALWRDAAQAASDDEDLARLASAVAPPGTSVTPALAAAAVIADAADALSRLRLAKSGGEDQDVIPGKPLAHPLAVRASVALDDRDVPVSGARVRWSTGDGRLALGDAPPTGADGTTAAAVSLVQKSGGVDYAARAELDLRALRGADGPPGWSQLFERPAPAATFALRYLAVKTRRRVFVGVSEKGAPEPVLGAALRRKLEDAGWAVVDDRATAEVIVSGESHAAALGKTELGESAAVKGELTVKLASTGASIAHLDLDEKGFGATSAQAAAKAYRTAAARVPDALAARLANAPELR